MPAKIRLGKRLGAILNEVPAGIYTLADIGTDHGKIAVSVLLCGKAKRVIATDISAASLAKCKALACEHGVLNGLDCRVGDGLAPIKEGEADFIVIAGMGGIEIVKILRNADYQGKLLLVPHQDADILREFLVGKYAVQKDFVVEEASKFYNIIVADKGVSDYSRSQILFGKDNPHTDDYRKMLIALRAKYKYIADINNLKENIVLDKLKEVEALCKQLEI